MLQKPNTDLTKAIKLLQDANKEGKTPPDLSKETRTTLVAEMLDEGFTKAELATLFGVDRGTIYRDIARYQKDLIALGYQELPHISARSINTRFETLYAKAMKLGDIKLALDIDVKRIEKLQSIGAMVRVKDEIKITDDTTRTKDQVIDAIFERIADVGTGPNQGGLATVQE